MIEAAGAPATPLSGWRAFHIHYHADLNRVLRELARPLLQSLASEGHLQRFFFVRSGLGGPHLRLRLHAARDQEDALRDRVHAEARAFLHRSPSTAGLSEDELRRIHEPVLRTDPSETDEALYPDNLVREVPFYPEIERYGGHDLLEPSLDFFTLSSVQALRLIAVHGDQPRARLLPMMFQALWRQAFGLAADTGELSLLLSFAAAAGGDAMSSFVQRGDRVFEERAAVFARLLERELDDLATPETEAHLAAQAAGLLAGALRHAEPATRRRILSSHVHMTANRLGMNNPEEIYIGRIVWRAMKAHDPEALARRLAARSEPADAAQRLRDQVAMALAGLSL